MYNNYTVLKGQWVGWRVKGRKEGRFINLNNEFEFNFDALNYTVWSGPTHSFTACRKSIRCCFEDTGYLKMYT